MSFVRNAVSGAMLAACLAQSAIAQPAPTAGFAQPVAARPIGSASAAVVDPGWQARQTLEQMALAAQQAQQVQQAAKLTAAVNPTAAMPAGLPPPVATPYVLGASPMPTPPGFPDVAIPPAVPQLRALAGKPGAYFAEIADNGFVYKVAAGQRVGNSRWILSAIDMQQGTARLQSDKPAAHPRKAIRRAPRASLDLRLARPDGPTGFAASANVPFSSH